MSEETRDDVLHAIDQLRRDLSGYHGQLVAHNELAKHCDNQRKRIADLEGLYAKAKVENAKLREQLERVQPTDCEGNVLDIADTVDMLRSEYDGDHEWEDVVTELVLTKWGGDRWIVRGSKGEAWACDCTKTGYDEDAYEASDDVEPFSEPTLLEVENAKLRELLKESLMDFKEYAEKYDLAPYLDDVNEHLDARMRELGIEVGA